MKDKQYYIETIVQKFSNGSDELDALLFLRQEGLDEADCKEIMEAALVQKRKEDRPRLAKKNRSLFVFWITLTIVVFSADLFLLPDAALIDYKFILCLLGTAALAVCSHSSILYYKTWTADFLEKRGEVNINFQAFPLLMIPAVLVFFLMSWRFSSAADRSLAKDMIKTKGTIVSGYSISSRRTDVVSNVTVRFKTKEGKSITTTEDISSYAFKNFYEGQEVDMVYSKSNPTNIDLLTSESDIKDLTHSAERNISPTDLFELMKVAPADVEAYLDKIAFGWQFDESSATWINEKKQLALKISPGNVTFTAMQSMGLIFPKRLKELGFRSLDSGPREPYSLKPRLFENDSYMVSIEYKNIQNTIICIIGVVKK